MEKCKQTLDLYYTLKTIIPELMCGWDVNEPWFDTIVKHVYAFPMPSMTTDLDRISVYGFVGYDGKDFDFWEFFKLVLIGFEIRINEDYNLKDIFVIDFKNCTLGHVAKFTLPLMKKFELCFMRGYHSRLRGIHYINTPPYAEFVVAIVKTVMKSKLVSRIHVHGTDLTEFYKRVPKELLPEEMGGTSGTIQENWSRWQKKMKSYRDCLVKRENMKSDESKRPHEKLNSSELFGFEGSFRKMNMD
ncbi:hypothetical protein L9F63_010700 [Diploptera punctata]|uniref:CRAL-TRIO domain-containing protein n=1 Tax=Diploptera punctata TaxID=6984 RepID=A0AAD8AGE1_DIPPU|nr:hypothetical protein L9F63_010700 [Diploptera punctata]